MNAPKQTASPQKLSGPVAHSTPSKTPPKSLRFSETTDRTKGVDMTDGAASPPVTKFIFKRDFSLKNPHLVKNGSKSESDESERETVIKQRTELQLLINELKDRDKELNEMVQAHQQQMNTWEEDRLRTHALEEKSAKLERDLNKRNHQVRELLKKLKAVETNALETSSALNDTQCRLTSTLAEHNTVFQQLKDLETYNCNLQQSFKQVSQSLGDTEAKVSHLQCQLSTKEKEATMTSREITELAAKLQSLEYSYKQLEKITFDVKTSSDDWKKKYTELKQSYDSIKNELDISNATVDEKDDELEKLRKELHTQQNELTFALERESRKDQLLALQKSKQERADKELSALRQMYDLQQQKLASTRKELTDMKEREIKLRTSFSQLNDSKEVFEASTIESSPSRSLVNQRSPLSRSYSPSYSRGAHRYRGDDSLDDRYENNLRSSTDRLQKLLTDSKRIVETITSNESKSPPT